MSIDNINQAATAMNALTARMNNFVGDADAQIAQRRAAYDGLAADLKGVVNGQMYFVGYVKPNEPNPTNIDGGTFLTIYDAVVRSPYGAQVMLFLDPGIHEVTSDIPVGNRMIYIDKNGVEKPVILLKARASDVFNYPYHFDDCRNGAVYIKSCEIEFPAEKIDDSLEWNDASSVLLQYTVSGFNHLSLTDCKGSGDAPFALVTGNGSCTNVLGLHSTTLDGTIVGVSRTASGVSIISKQSLTLLNGALVRSTTGDLPNILENGG